MEGCIAAIEGLRSQYLPEPFKMRVEEDGRIPVPKDMPAGEYAMGVFVSGTQGEADYSFRIAVER